jgi:hydroxymethylpyrimidine pyrophosphatase-like HAD family hydrolase
MMGGIVAFLATKGTFIALVGVGEDRGVGVAEWSGLAAGVRLVATDLDGTLLRPDGSVSAFTVDVLARARAAELPVVFATGRPPRWMPPVVDVTGHLGAAICANGALVIDLVDGHVLERHPIPHDALVEVVETLRAEVPGIAFAIEYAPESENLPFAHESGYQARYPVDDAHRGPDVRALARGRDVVKLLARVGRPGRGALDLDAADSHHADADAFLARGEAHVAHLVTLTHSDADDVLLEMSAPGVSKGAALADYARSLGVAASQAAAVGDMPNDVPMLAWAGVPLAVEGAHRSVVEAAAAVLPGPSDDGVARFVEAVLSQP